MPSSRAILPPRLAARNGRGSLRPASIAREGCWDGRLGRLSGAAHDETEELSHAELGKIKGNRDALAEREKELRVGPRPTEMEAAAEGQPGVDDLTDELLSYMARFQQVVAEGTVDEKRRFVRAFVQRIQLDPSSCFAHVSLLSLPAASAHAGHGPTASRDLRLTTI